MSTKKSPPSGTDTKPYRKGWIDLWHDQRFKKLSVIAQHTYTLLREGPQTESLPLLQQASAGILEAHCPALGYDNIKAGLAELLTAGLIDYADDAPVIALPYYCEDDLCKSFKALVGWLKVYQRLPDGVIKTRYTPALKSRVDWAANDDEKNPLATTWAHYMADTEKGYGKGYREGYPIPVISDQGSVISNQGTVSSESEPAAGASGTRTLSLSKSKSKKGKKAAEQDKKPGAEDFKKYLYAEYPRKSGKQRGIDACIERMTSWESLWHAYWGIQQYKYEIEQSDANGGSNWAEQTPKCFDTYITSDAWEESAERFVESGLGLLVEARWTGPDDPYGHEPIRRLTDVFERVNQARGAVGAAPLEPTWRNQFWIVVRLAQGRTPQQLLAALDLAMSDSNYDVVNSSPLWTFPEQYWKQQEQEKTA